MHALMNLPNPSNELRSLREFHDANENHVCELLALGWATYSYVALLVPMVLGKFPIDTRKNLARQHNCLEWTIDQLRDCIAQEISVLEVGLCNPTSLVQDHSHFPMATASFHTGTTSQSELKKLICAFCKGAHSAIRCDVILNQPMQSELD